MPPPQVEMPGSVLAILTLFHTQHGVRPGGSQSPNGRRLQSWRTEFTLSCKHHVEEIACFVSSSCVLADSFASDSGGALQLPGPASFLHPSPCSPRPPAGLQQGGVAGFQVSRHPQAAPMPRAGAADPHTRPPGESAPPPSAAGKAYSGHLWHHLAGDRETRTQGTTPDAGDTPAAPSPGGPSSRPLPLSEMAWGGRTDHGRLGGGPQGLPAGPRALATTPPPSISQQLWLRPTGSSDHGPAMSTPKKATAQQTPMGAPSWRPGTWVPGARPTWSVTSDEQPLGCLSCPRTRSPSARPRAA